MSEEKRLKENALSFWQLVFYAVVIMFPASAFVITGSTALSYSGPVAPLAFLVGGGLLYLAIIAVYAYSTRVANAGGYYKFIEASVSNPYLSKGIGLLQVLYYLSIMWFTSVLSGWLFWTSMETLFGISVPLYVVILLSIIGPILYIIIGYRSISVSGNLAIVVGVIEIIVFGVIAALLIAKSPYNGLQYFNVNNSLGGLSGFFTAVVVGGFLSYSGYGSIVMYGEEAKTPHRTLKLAIVVAALIIIVYETFVVYAVAASAGPTLSQGLQFFAPGFYYTKQYLGSAFLLLSFVVILFDQIMAPVFNGNAFARILYALSRDNVLPSSLYDVHPKHRSPYKAVLLIGALTIAGTIALIIAFVQAYGMDVGLFYAWLVPGTVLSIIWGLYHIVVNQALPFLMRKLGRLNVLYHIVGPTLSSVTLAVALYFTAYGLSWPVSIAYYVLPIWIIASIIYIAAIRKRIKMEVESG